MREFILKELEKNSEEYEVYLQKTEINEIHLQKNKISFIDKTIDSGYGVRVHEKGMGFSSSNIFSPVGIRQTIKNALKSSDMTQKLNLHFLQNNHSKK